MTVEEHPTVHAPNIDQPPEVFGEQCFRQECNTSMLGHNGQAEDERSVLFLITHDQFVHLLNYHLVNILLQVVIVDHLELETRRSHSLPHRSHHQLVPKRRPLQPLREINIHYPRQRLPLALRRGAIVHHLYLGHPLRTSSHGRHQELMHERTLKDNTTRSPLGCLLDELRHLMCPRGQDGEIFERTHLRLQFGEVAACECLDDALCRTPEGTEVFVQPIRVVVGVESVQAVVLDGIESGVLREQLFVLLVEGKLTGKEEALVIWIVSPQPTEAVLELSQSLLHLLALLQHPHVLIQEVPYVLCLLTTRQEEILQRGRLHMCLSVERHFGGAVAWREEAEDLGLRLACPIDEIKCFHLMDPGEVLVGSYLPREEYPSILVEESEEDGLPSDALRVVLEISISSIHPLAESQQEVAQFLSGGGGGIEPCLVILVSHKPHFETTHLRVAVDLSQHQFGEDLFPVYLYTLENPYYLGHVGQKLISPVLLQHLRSGLLLGTPLSFQIEPAISANDLITTISYQFHEE